MLVQIESKMSPWVRQMDIKKTSTRNTHPHAEQGVYLKKNSSTGKFITGYEFNGIDYKAILSDNKHPDYLKAMERSIIERVLGIDLDNSEEGSFLEKLRIPLCRKDDGNKNPKITLDLTKPIDKLMYSALITGGVVGPNKEALNEVGFTNCMYYFSNAATDESEKKETSKVRNRIGAKLAIFDTNRLWLLAMNKNFNLIARKELSNDVLYTQLDDYKQGLTTVISLKKMESVVNETPEEITYKFVIESAKELFKITKKDGFYYYNNMKLGATDDLVQQMIRQAKNDDLFKTIRAEVFEHYGIVK